ncbi:sodium- and chloride-dependent glycine transporter 2-like [Pecten maximus]|uniref:sodium- and chloride-dependent glycine transporter 2-like n=1 Tax=Pecten maximus TaxID=6579 RepID=UPI001457F18E|nr:sodium- and chloride-dependent glycine transporter 2-like [Pecten maximus]XP_033764046.1 sodium- and chloride-dependent glycine transporter 2-like [Pecten maximus]
MADGKQANARGNWNNWYEYLFSCIGCLVGLGNIWRFPYVCYKNGGGAFLIPYFFFMAVSALPLMLLEISYSQYSNLGPGRVWICCPLFKGIGYGMVTLTGIVSIYYNVILAWTLYYFGMSFSSVLPWSHCNNEWNSPDCYTRIGRTNNSVTFNTTGETYNKTENRTAMTSSEEFWQRNVLDISDNVETMGGIRWQLALALFAAWIAVFLCLIKGIKTSGKVVYVAATVPYIFLLTLFIRGMTLPGSKDGLLFYLIPRWSDLGKLSVWGDAAVQMFYSAGIGWGGMATLASYNNFNNNCYRDAMLLPLLDALTSWFAGMVIFATLGYMANEAGVHIGDVVASGPGIAFMVYPEALSTLPLPQLWSVLFFLMLFTVGLDSQMVHVQTITGALTDNFPNLFRSRKTTLTAGVCLTGFLLGIPCVMQGGIYVLTLIDWYCASVSVMFLSLLEVVVIAWVYGADRLMKDIEMMIGYRPNPLWKIMLRFIAPSIIFFIWVFSVAKLEPVEYDEQSYPEWSISIGWFIAIMSLVPIPVGIVRELFTRKGGIAERFRASIIPSPQWKPAVCQVNGNKEALEYLTVHSEQN